MAKGHVMKIPGRVLIGATAVVLLAAAVATAPVGAIDPPPEEDMARMTQMMNQMHQSMQEMQRDMQHMPGMGAMHGRMGRAMGTMEQMRGMMREHREQMRRQCPAVSPAPKKDG
jgi:hypothetical protein